MPTPNGPLGLYTFLENEAVNFNHINENFSKLAECVMCVESGTAFGECSGAKNQKPEWFYKKYSDGSFEMSTKVEYINFRCNEANGSLYQSGISKLSFPNNGSIDIGSIYDVQMHKASNDLGWVVDVSGFSIGNPNYNYLNLRLLSPTNEGTSGEYYKQVFVTVKGVLA